MPLSFHLYRLKIERSGTLPLFGDRKSSPGEVILSAIKEKPKIQKGHQWRIGNIEEIEDKKKVLFAFGKITKATHRFYDEGEGDFIEESQEEAPHTHIAIDLDLQVCAIARKSGVVPGVGIIARNLVRLLNASKKAEDNHLHFTLSAISEPTDFLTLLENAIRITTFEVTFSPPNPWDVQKDFHKPLEDYLGAVGGNRGKISVKGEVLNNEPIEEIVRSVASTGDTAKAHIQSENDEKPVLKRLGENLLIINVSELTEEEKAVLFKKIEASYNAVRRGRDSE